MDQDRCELQILPCQEHLGAWLISLPLSLDLRKTLEQVERKLIVRALRNADGVQAEAARNLGISRSDMAYKLKKYGLKN